MVLVSSNVVISLSRLPPINDAMTIGNSRPNGKVLTPLAAGNDTSQVPITAIQDVTAAKPIRRLRAWCARAYRKTTASLSCTGRVSDGSQSLADPRDLDALGLLDESPNSGEIHAGRTSMHIRWLTSTVETRPHPRL